MAKALKIYYVERRLGIVALPIRSALGLPDHVQQVEIFVLAPTGRSARELLGSVMAWPSPPPVQLAHGNNAQALLAADLPGPAVFVYAGLGYGAPDRRVLRVDQDGSTHRVGRLEGVAFGAVAFVAEGGA